MQSGLQAINISVEYMDEPSGVTQEEGHRILFYFLHYIIAGASSNLLILLVETVTQFCVYQYYKYS